MARRAAGLVASTLVAVVAAAGCSGLTSDSLSCPGAVTPGAICESAGMACPYVGCSGCFCGEDKRWTCPATTAAPGRCCTTGTSRATIGMPCDDGDGNACGGACWPDLIRGTAFLDCVPATAPVLLRMGIASLDGVDCAPDGLPGSDCAHACTGGACEAVDAAHGVSCVPASEVVDSQGGSTCDGQCDGAGACQPAATTSLPMQQGDCVYVSCLPGANAVQYATFNEPAGLSCSTGAPCQTGGRCDDQGNCAGVTNVAGCAPPEYDE